MQPLPLAQLMEHFRRLPGIGPKTAARLAYHVLGMEREQALALANSIIEAKDKIRFCSVCFSLTDTDPCAICRSETRDHGLICVVEEPRDVAAMAAYLMGEGGSDMTGALLTMAQGGTA